MFVCECGPKNNSRELTGRGNVSAPTEHMQIWYSLGHFGPFAFTTSAAQCQQSQQRRHSLPFPLALRHLWSSSHHSWLIALDHLLALYSLFNQWLSAFHRGLETCPRKWQIAPLILPGCSDAAALSLSPPPAVSVMSTHPFLSILSPCVVFLVCVPCRLSVFVFSGWHGS